jgi:hypothetical protein
MPVSRFVVALLAPLLVSGCGSSGETAPARAADAFEAAVSAGDGAGACALLAAATRDELEQSSGQPCAEAVLDDASDGGRREGVERYGKAAQARYRGDVLFLTDGPQGWRVTAAGCRRTHGGAPYDCEISGG